MPPLTRDEFEAKFPVMFMYYRAWSLMSREQEATVKALSKYYEKQGVHWTDSSYRLMSIPEWVVRRGVMWSDGDIQKSKSLCMSWNHSSGKGCLSKAECGYKHRCILCEQTDHGLFFTKSNGRYACNKLFKWEKEAQIYKAEYGEVDEKFLRELARTRTVRTQPVAPAKPAKTVSNGFSLLDNSDSESEAPEAPEGSVQDGYGSSQAALSTDGAPEEGAAFGEEEPGEGAMGHEDWQEWMSPPEGWPDDFRQRGGVAFKSKIWRKVVRGRPATFEGEAAGEGKATMAQQWFCYEQDSPLSAPEQPPHQGAAAETDDWPPGGALQEHAWPTLPGLPRSPRIALNLRDEFSKEVAAFLRGVPGNCMLMSSMLNPGTHGSAAVAAAWQAVRAKEFPTPRALVVLQSYPKSFLISWTPENHPIVHLVPPPPQAPAQEEPSLNPATAALLAAGPPDSPAPCAPEEPWPQAPEPAFALEPEAAQAATEELAQLAAEGPGWEPVREPPHAAAVEPRLPPPPPPKPPQEEQPSMPQPTPHLAPPRPTPSQPTPPQPPPVKAAPQMAPPPPVPLKPAPPQPAPPQPAPLQAQPEPPQPKPPPLRPAPLQPAAPRKAPPQLVPQSLRPAGPVPAKVELQGRLAEACEKAECESVSDTGSTPSTVNRLLQEGGLATAQEAEFRGQMGFRLCGDVNSFRTPAELLHHLLEHSYREELQEYRHVLTQMTQENHFSAPGERPALLSVPEGHGDEDGPGAAEARRQRGPEPQAAGRAVAIETSVAEPGVPGDVEAMVNTQDDGPMVVAEPDEVGQGAPAEQSEEEIVAELDSAIPGMGQVVVNAKILLLGQGRQLEQGRCYALKLLQWITENEAVEFEEVTDSSTEVVAFMGMKDLPAKRFKRALEQGMAAAAAQ